MLNFVFIGLPGSGKSTIAKMFFDTYSLVLKLVNVDSKLIEISDLVKLDNLDPLVTDVQSQKLKIRLLNSLCEGVNVISGIREPYLLENLNAFVVLVNTPKSKRLLRYLKLDKDLKEADFRAVELGFEKIICDFTIPGDLENSLLYFTAFDILLRQYFRR